jgi:hypothetical protein
MDVPFRGLAAIRFELRRGHRPGVEDRSEHGVRGGGHFRHPRFTHAVEKGLEPSEIRWVVARRRPIDAGAGHMDAPIGRRADLQGSRREQLESDGDRAFGVTRTASSSPEAALRQTLDQRPRFGDLRHFRCG